MLDQLPAHKKTNHYVFLDEVGRGCLAGPVVVGGCLWSPSQFNATEVPASWQYLRNCGVQDSKKVAENKRAPILEKLKLNPFLYHSELFSIQGDQFQIAHDQFEVDVIEKINILASTMELMRKVTIKLCKDLPLGEVVTVIIDGKEKIANLHMQQIKFEQLAVAKSDYLFAPTGLASLYAKVYRDHLMQVWDSIYPNFHMGKHKGYGTAKHLESIKTYGPTPIHRRTFGGVKEHLSR